MGATRFLAAALWCVLLVAPSLTVFSSTNAWDVAPAGQLAWTVWLFAMLWWLVGRRWFLLLTFPLALFGAAALGADALRSVNLLELVLVTGVASSGDARAALRPYLAYLVLAALLLAACAALLLRPRQPFVTGAWPRRASLAVLLGAALVLGVLSPLSGLRAWPANLAASAYAASAQRNDLLSSLLPYGAVNPRDANASWQARRTRADSPGREVYVLIIGESVRADRLRACGGPRAVGPAAQPAPVVYCDVIAGSSSTHTAVPLLISRDAPGGPARVSSDATFVKAFEQAGFRTYWLSVQEREIAWPDAQHSMYAKGQGTDRALLLPELRKALGEPGARKLIVLHAMNAHFDYCTRYAADAVVAPVDCAKLGSLPSAATRERWLAGYDNAVQESMLFIDEVVTAVRQTDAQSFVSYVPDHGENILDDERALFQHALAFPTRWDTRVPMVFWADERWRAAHAGQWAMLAGNAARQAMHADLVPTLAGAAGIAYAEGRASVADLTRAAPPPRTRWVLRRLGELVDGDKL